MSDQITHVIFDLDNTLINTIDVLLNLFSDYAKQQQKPFDCNAIIRCLSDLESLAKIFDVFYDSIDLSKDIDRNGLNRQLFQQLMSKEFRLLAGVDRLVKHLHKNGIPMAIATGSPKRVYDIMNKNVDNYFDQYFSHCVCGADDIEVKNNKPNPEVYTVCAKRFTNKPKEFKNILIVEDSISGIAPSIAASALGMKTLLIDEYKITKLDEISDKITKIVYSFNDLKPESIGLPAYAS